jgi:sarcosine oxidase gamma subunit
MNQRTPPFDIGLMPEKIKNLNGWPVALTYVGEKRRNRLFLTDLSHVPKWAFHRKDMDGAQPFGLKMSRKPGQVRVEGDRLGVRLTPSKCLIMVLRGEAPVPEDVAYTDVSEGYAAFAVVGSSCLDLLGKLSPVDLEASELRAPCAAQAPVHDLRCVILRLEGKEAISGLIILGERGYGPFLLNVLLDAGKQFGISPAGWRRFETWLKR